MLNLQRAVLIVQYAMGFQQGEIPLFLFVTVELGVTGSGLISTEHCTLYKQEVYCTQHTEHRVLHT